MASEKLDQRYGRHAILIEAEKLFADFGLHGVSLRQISEAAGQKNASAIQYHFGSRDGLVEAVFAHRMSVINPRRHAALDEVVSSGRTGDIRALVGVMVWPMAEELRPRAEGNHYLQFLSRAAREKMLAVELAPPELLTAWVSTIEHLKKALRYLPGPVALNRILLASEQCISSLAILEAEGVSQSRDLIFKVETLIDMIAAGLSAPVSDRTLKAMEPARST